MNRNKLMIFTLFFIIGGTMIGCGGSEKEVEEKKKKPNIVGKWELDSKVLEKALKDEGLEGEGLDMALTLLSSMSMTFEFKKDGTFLVSMSAFGESQSESGEWKVDGSTLKTRQGQGDWEQIEISLSGDELIMKKGEESLGFKRVK